MTGKYDFYVKPPYLERYPDLQNGQISIWTMPSCPIWTVLTPLCKLLDIAQAAL
jgi:hypothetical protein